MSISATASTAREQARTASGRFGEQPRDEVDVTIPSSYRGVAELTAQLPSDITALLVSEDDTGLSVIGAVRRGRRIELEDLDLDDRDAFYADVSHATATPGGNLYRWSQAMMAHRVDLRPDPWGMDLEVEVPALARQAVLSGDVNLFVEAWDAAESGGDPDWAPSDEFDGEGRYSFKRIADYVGNCMDVTDPSFHADIVDHESGGGAVLSMALDDGSGTYLSLPVEDGDMSTAGWSVRGRAQAVGMAQRVIDVHATLRRTRSRLLGLS